MNKIDRDKSNGTPLSQVAYTLTENFLKKEATMSKENSAESKPTFAEGFALSNHNKYRKYNQAELETAIKQEMLNHSWPSDVIPASIKFGVSNVHRCGSRSEYGYTAGDGCVFLYDYRNGGTEPIKINYSELGIESTSMTDEEVEESKRIAEEAE
jgi:hypothetical protein